MARREPLREAASFEVRWLSLGRPAPPDLGRLIPAAGMALEVSGPPELIEAHRSGLPPGPAGAEALTVLLRHLGATPVWAEAATPIHPRELLALYRSWGRDSVQVARRHPALLQELALGGWFDRGAVGRLARRLVGPLTPRAPRNLKLGIAADAAYWAGVREAATAEEWRRLTRGYTVLLYHRLAGELKPGQERVDVPARKFDAQMRLLKTLRFATPTPAQLVELHAAGADPLPRRAAILTVDDAFEDTVEPLRSQAALHPVLFVPTSDVGSTAAWLGGERIASWEHLLGLAKAGVELGAHSRTHADLPSLDEVAARDEIAGSRDDLQVRLGRPPLAFAYPHGRASAREVRLVRDAGYRLAFTTEQGRNGVAADPYLLRRVSMKAWDTRLSFLWKLLTGEQPPPSWERWLLLRAAIGARLGRARPGAAASARAPAPPDAVQRRRRAL